MSQRLIRGTCHFSSAGGPWEGLRSVLGCTRIALRAEETGGACPTVILIVWTAGVEPFPAPGSLRIVGIFDLDPRKRVPAGLRLRNDSFQVLLTHQLEESHSGTLKIGSLARMSHGTNEHE